MTNTTLTNNTLAKVIFFKGTLKLVSPLTLGNGNDSSTDKDFSTDYDENPFIPATSLAGSIIHFFEKYISDENDKKTFQKLFGTLKNNGESMQSNIIFYDLPAVEYHTEIRDGIKVDYSTKITEKNAKYDYEILSYNSTFDFKLKVIVRKEDNQNMDKILSILKSMFQNIDNGNIRFGAKTSRGFGKVELTDLKYKSFNFITKEGIIKKEQIKDYFDFSWVQCDKPFTKESDLKLNFKKLTIKLNFKIPYSIMIKKVDFDLNGVDALHLSSKDKSNNSDKYVIPATSWVGAINTSIHNIGKILNKVDKINDIKDNLFGYIKKEEKIAQISRIIIEESIILDAALIKYTRNAIDRFTGGTVHSALFTEKALYGGTVLLEFHVIDPKEYEIELLHLALRDFCNGIQSIGGETNIGRGILELEKEEGWEYNLEKNYKLDNYSYLAMY